MPTKYIKTHQISLGRKLYSRTRSHIFGEKIYILKIKSIIRLKPCKNYLKRKCVFHFLVPYPKKCVV